MSLTIRNTTEYPDREVESLVRWAMKPFGVRETLVVVSYARRGPYSGMAYDGLPADMKPWPKSAWYGIKLRIGRPDEFPMEHAYWRHGTEDDHWGEWPLFRHDTWQDCLIALAAHEAKHNEDFREGKRQRGSKLRRSRELTCELTASRVLAEYKTSPPIVKEEIMAEEAATGNGLRAELVAAMKAVPGVTVKEKPGYDTFKFGKTTLGYVGGKRRVNLGLPQREGKRENMDIQSKADVEKAVEKMRTYIPAEKPAKKAEPAPKNDQPIEGTVVLESREVTPDPKPAKTNKRGAPVKA